MENNSDSLKEDAKNLVEDAAKVGGDVANLASGVATKVAAEVVDAKKVVAKKATTWILETEEVLKKFEDQALHLLDHPINGIHSEVKKFLDLIGKAKTKAVVVPGGDIPVGNPTDSTGQQSLAK